MLTARRRVVFRPFVALLALAVVVGGSACGPNPDSPSSVTGTWVGTVVSSIQGNIAMQLTLTQSGSSISGTFAQTAPGAASSFGGPLTGTVSGSSFTAALVFGTCTRTWTGTWSGTTLSGTYVASGVCSNMDTGSFTETLN